MSVTGILCTQLERWDIWAGFGDNGDGRGTFCSLSPLWGCRTHTVPGGANGRSASSLALPSKHSLLEVVCTEEKQTYVPVCVLPLGALQPVGSWAKVEHRSVCRDGLFLIS